VPLCAGDEHLVGRKEAHLEALFQEYNGTFRAVATRADSTNHVIGIVAKGHGTLVIQLVD